MPTAPNSEIPISLNYYRLQVLDFLINDLREAGNLWQLDERGKRVGTHAIIGQLLGLARQEMTEVVAEAKSNIYIDNQIRQYFIATGEEITAEQAQELSPFAGRSVTDRPRPCLLPATGAGLAESGGVKSRLRPNRPR